MSSVKDYSSDSEENEEESTPLKIWTGPDSYITKKNGQLLTIRKKNRRPARPASLRSSRTFRSRNVDLRPRQRSSVFNTGLEILSQAFRAFKMNPDSAPTESSESTSNSTRSPTPNSTLNTPQNGGTQMPHVPTMFPPGMMPPMMGPSPPVGIYEYGGRKLALLPKGAAGMMSGMQPQFGMPFGYPPGMAMPGFHSYQPYYGASVPQPVVIPMPVPAAAALAAAENSPAETEPVVAVAVPMHVCAGCGNARSRKYHAEHLLQPGEIPLTSYCAKCQNAASTEESGSEESVSKNKKAVNKKKHKGKGRKKKTEIETEDDSSGSAKSKTPAKPKAKKKRLSGSLTEKITLVDEYPEERGRRGYRYVRVKLRDDEERRRSPSPLVSQYSPRRSRSMDFDRNNERQEQSPPRPRIIITERVQDGRHYRKHERRVRASSIDDAISERDSVSYRTDSLPPRPRSPPRRVYRHETRDIYERPSSANTQRSNFREKTSEESSMGSRPGSSRRREERNHADDRGRMPVHTTLPPDIRPPKENEVVVVTERIVYRPKRAHHERVHRENDGERSQGHPVSAFPNKGYISNEDTAEYYPKEWTQTERHPREREPHRAHPRDIESMYPESSRRGSSDTSHERFDGNRPSPYLPEAPSPPSTLSSRRDFDTFGNVSDHTIPYPPSVDSDPRYRRQTSPEPASYASGEESEAPRPQRRSRKLQKERTPSPIRRRKSNHRPPYVREATDNGTEKSLVPSPHHSRERERARYYEEDVSEMSGALPYDARHVSFGQNQTYTLSSRDSLSTGDPSRTSSSRARDDDWRTHDYSYKF